MDRKSSISNTTHTQNQLKLMKLVSLLSAYNNDMKGQLIIIKPEILTKLKRNQL